MLISWSISRPPCRDHLAGRGRRSSKVLLCWSAQVLVSRFCPPGREWPSSTAVFHGRRPLSSLASPNLLIGRPPFPPSCHEQDNASVVTPFFSFSTQSATCSRLLLRSPVSAAPSSVTFHKSSCHPQPKKQTRHCRQIPREVRAPSTPCAACRSEFPAGTTSFMPCETKGRRASQKIPIHPGQGRG